MTLDQQTIELVLSVLVPLFVALVTKSSASPKLKSAVLFVASAAATALGELAGLSQPGGSVVIDQEWLVSWATNTAIALAAYLAFWKPVVNVNSKTLPNFGLGKAPTPPPPPPWAVSLPAPDPRERVFP